MDGYDEISLTGATKTISRNTESMLIPENFNLNAVTPNDIKGGMDVAESAGIFMSILQGQGTHAQNNVVAANAGVAISTALNCSLQDGFIKAKESLLKGKALNTLRKLQALSK